MTSTILKYGIRSGVLVAVLSWLNFYLTADLDPVVSQVGSMIVLLAMTPFIFQSMNEVKSRASGKLPYWSAFFAGSGVAFVTAICMFASTILFMFMNRGSFEEWSTTGSDTGIPPGDIVVMNPFEQAFIMLLIVLITGSIFSLVFSIFARSNPGTLEN